LRGGHFSASQDGRAGRGLCYAPGSQPGGASSKPLKSKGGATVQPNSVQSPRQRALCQAPGATASCGSWLAARSGPRRYTSRRLPSGESDNSSTAPAYQCQISALSTRCQRDTSPALSRKKIAAEDASRKVSRY